MQLYPTAENPLPPGIECVTVVTRDGVKLRGLHAVPGQAAGTVVVLGGRGDFAERYFETMYDLMTRGFAVASVDFRGQGGSQRPLGDLYRGHIRSFAGFEEDVRAFMEDVVLKRCPPPYYVLAHSTGGQVVLRVLREKTWFRKAVLASPLVDVRYGAWPRPVAALVVGLANLLGLGRLFLPGVMKRPMTRQHFPGNPLTSDEWRWNRDSGTLEEAPHLGLGGATFSWLRAARRSFADMKRVSELKSPVLIVAAGNDRVVSNTAIRRLARQIPGISLIFVPGARHELLSERDEIRGQFFAAFDSFITQDG